jgi:hypothetical protein
LRAASWVALTIEWWKTTLRVSVIRPRENIAIAGVTA